MERNCKYGENTPFLKTVNQISVRLLWSFFTYRLTVEGRSLRDKEQTILFGLSTLFSPVVLFCIFLSEVNFIKHSHKGISCTMFHVCLVICSIIYENP